MKRRNFLAALGLAALIPKVKVNAQDTRPAGMQGADIPKCGADYGRVVGVAYISGYRVDVKTGRAEVSAITKDGTIITGTVSDGFAVRKKCLEQ